MKRDNKKFLTEFPYQNFMSSSFFLLRDTDRKKSRQPRKPKR